MRGKIVVDAHVGLSHIHIASPGNFQLPSRIASANTFIDNPARKKAQGPRLGGNGYNRLAAQLADRVAATNMQVSEALKRFHAVSMSIPYSLAPSNAVSLSWRE